MQLYYNPFSVICQAFFAYTKYMDDCRVRQDFPHKIWWIVPLRKFALKNFFADLQPFPFLNRIVGEGPSKTPKEAAYATAHRNSN